MKIFNLLIASLMVVAVVSCAKDSPKDGPDFTGREKAQLVIQISQSNPGTYALTTDEPAVTGEIEFTAHDVIIVILDKSADAVEIVEKISGVQFDTDGNKTTPIEVTSGEKYVYCLMNTITGTDSDLAIGMTRAAFEKKIIAASADDISVTGEMVITNISTPTPVYCAPNDVNCYVKIEVGRVAAKIYAEFDAAPADQSSGLLTDVEFKLAGIPTEMFRIGQFDAAQLKTPNYDNARISTPDPDYLTYYVKEAGYQDMEDITNGVSKPSTSYTLENAHSTPQEGNTTRMIVRGTFEPYDVVDGTDGVTPVSFSAGSSFWTVDDGVNDLIFCDSDPTGQSWLAGTETISDEYVNGKCYYNKVWIADNSEADSKKYSVIRNHFYKVAIKYVKGVGTPDEDDDINIIDPVEHKSKLEVEVDILPWALINQNTGLEGQ